MGAAARATGVDSAIEGLWTSRRSRRRSISAWLGSAGSCRRRRRVLQQPGSTCPSGYSTSAAGLKGVAAARRCAPVPLCSHPQASAAPRRRMRRDLRGFGWIAPTRLLALAVRSPSRAARRRPDPARRQLVPVSPAGPHHADAAQMRARLAGSPAPLAALHAQADQSCSAAARGAARAPARPARLAGGDQQVGLLVRALSGRARGLPAGRRLAGARGRVHRHRLRRHQPRRRARVPARRARSGIRATTTRAAELGAAIADSVVHARDRVLRPRRRTSTSTRAPTRAPPSSNATSARYALDE